MKFKVISTLGNEHNVELQVVPRQGEQLEGCRILSVNYLIDSEYIAELNIESVKKEKPKLGDWL